MNPLGPVTYARIPLIMTPVRADLPSGTVTFLFTDVEGSTKLLDELGAEAYAEALVEHRRVAARGVRRAKAASRWTHRAMRSSTPSPLPTELCLRPARAKRRSRRPNPRAHGPAHGHSARRPRRATSARRPPGARIAAAGHGGQVLVSGDRAARRRRACATSASTASRTSPTPERDLPARRSEPSRR